PARGRPRPPRGRPDDPRGRGDAAPAAPVRPAADAQGLAAPLLPLRGRRAAGRLRAARGHRPDPDPHAPGLGGGATGALHGVPPQPGEHARPLGPTPCPPPNPNARDRRRYANDLRITLAYLREALRLRSLEQPVAVALVLSKIDTLFPEAQAAR